MDSNIHGNIGFEYFFELFHFKFCKTYKDMFNIQPITISYQARIKKECHIFSLNKQESSKITVARKESIKIKSNSLRK